MITFVTADPDPESSDSKRIWEWRNDPLTRQMSRTADSIAWEHHAAWYAATKATLLMASAGGVLAGTIRFDLLDAGRAEISINLNPALRGKGLGEPILAAGCTYGFETLGLAQIDADVKSENTASIKIFTRVGFVFQGAHEGLYRYQLKRG